MIARGVELVSEVPEIDTPGHSRAISLAPDTPRAVLPGAPVDAHVGAEDGDLRQVAPSAASGRVFFGPRGSFPPARACPRGRLGL